MLRERDAALRRFELDAIAACLLTALVALILAAGRLDAPLGVLGGGLLIGLSYWAIKGGVDALVPDKAKASFRPEIPGDTANRPQWEQGSAAKDQPSRQGATARHQPSEQDLGPGPVQPSEQDVRPARPSILVAVKFFTRYALLAVAAYVMLTCFRLHPVGLLAGASAPFLAAVVQLGRLTRARARRRHS